MNVVKVDLLIVDSTQKTNKIKLKIIVIVMMTTVII